MTEVVAIATMKSTSMAAANQKKPWLSIPSFSSKLATRLRASARASSSVSPTMSKSFVPSSIVAIVAMSTNRLER